jgi:broad specificity phosphatase PhoE
LADEFAAQMVTRIYSSVEPKALETAALVAMRLGLALEPHLNLHENDRTGLDFLGENQLHSRIQEFFNKPDEITIGVETANSARERFTRSIIDIVAHDHQCVAVVTHGTVLTLFAAHYNALVPFDLWLRLGLPSYVVLDPNSFSIEGDVHNLP